MTTATTLPPYEIAPATAGDMPFVRDTVARLRLDGQRLEAAQVPVPRPPGRGGGLRRPKAGVGAIPPAASAGPQPVPVAADGLRGAPEAGEPAANRGVQGARRCEPGGATAGGGPAARGRRRLDRQPRTVAGLRGEARRHGPRP